MNNNCMNCGAMVLDGATICPVCRQPLATAQGNAGWPQQPAGPNPWQRPSGQQIGPPPLASRSSGANPLMIVVAIVLLLVIVGGIGGFFYFMESRRKARTSVNENYNRYARTEATPYVYESPPTETNNRTGNNSRAPISGGVLNGKAIELPQPTYPSIAKAAKASGTVTVQVTVDESGKVISARAVAGHPLLQASAVQAARRARFAPTLLSGKPVKVIGILTYNFALEQNQE